MKKGIWCILNLHKWLYKGDFYRKCERCNKEQEMINAGEEASGMASGHYWQTIKKESPVHNSSS